MITDKENIEILLKWLDKEITIASYTEDRVKRALKNALIEINNREKEKEADN